MTLILNEQWQLSREQYEFKELDEGFSIHWSYSWLCWRSWLHVSSMQNYKGSAAKMTLASERVCIAVTLQHIGLNSHWCLEPEKCCQNHDKLTFSQNVVTLLTFKSAHSKMCEMQPNFLFDYYWGRFGLRCWYASLSQLWSPVEILRGENAQIWMWEILTNGLDFMSLPRTVKPVILSKRPCQVGDTKYQW